MPDTHTSLKLKKQFSHTFKQRRKTLIKSNSIKNFNKYNRFQDKPYNPIKHYSFLI